MAYNSQILEQIHNLDPSDKANLIATIVNDMTFPYKEVAKHLAYQHPTLQQNFMRLCACYIEEMAKKDYTDLRNEASAEFARIVVQRCENKMYFPVV
jgi:hypothetical protein